MTTNLSGCASYSVCEGRSNCCCCIPGHDTDTPYVVKYNVHIHTYACTCLLLSAHSKEDAKNSKTSTPPRALYFVCGQGLCAAPAAAGARAGAAALPSNFVLMTTVSTRGYIAYE